MTYAQPAEIAVLLGRAFTTEETAQAQGFINDAERQILRKYPTLTAMIAAGTVSVEDVRVVELRAGRRVMLNPDAKQNERTDDYSFGRIGAVADSEVVITDEEWSWLSPSVSTSDSFSIRMSGSGPRETYSPRAPVDDYYTRGTRGEFW